MKKEDLYQEFWERFHELEEALKGTDLERIKSLTLEVHALVHPAEISGRSEKTIADYCIDYMMEGHQNDIVPRENYETDLHYAGTNRVPMVWQLWHTYRIEDLITNILMMKKEQIFDADWQKRMGASITDTGNALTFEEAVEFCKGLDAKVLREYMITVGKNTRSIIASMTLEQVHAMPEENHVMNIYEAGGVTSDLRSVWLLVFWARLDWAGMILTPLTCHHMMHLPASLNNLPIL